MPLNAIKCHQMPLNAVKCLQMPSNASKCRQMPLNAFKCLQMPSNAAKCPQMPSNANIKKFSKVREFLLKCSNFHFYQHSLNTKKIFFQTFTESTLEGWGEKKNKGNKKVTF